MRPQQKEPSAESDRHCRSEREVAGIMALGPEPGTRGLLEV